MIKKTAIFAMIFLLISVSFFGCKSLVPNQTEVMVSNGTETIAPFSLLSYANSYDDLSGNWTSAEGIGGHQFDIADYEAEFPLISLTDNISIISPDKTKYSVKIYNAKYQVMDGITFADISTLAPGMYVLRMDIETTGRTIGNQTENVGSAGFVKIIVGAP